MVAVVAGHRTLGGRPWDRQRRHVRDVRDARRENARRAHVVADVDEQERKIARAPQHAREHDQSARLAEQRRQ